MGGGGGGGGVQFKKKSSELIVHGSCIQVKCQLKALIFGKCKKVIIMPDEISALSVIV